MLTPNTLLQNRYLVIRQLSKGGMGAVYLVRHQRLGKEFALKETFFSEDELLRRAFEREARLLANLDHPALPKVTDHFSEGDTQFLLMEYVPGQDVWHVSYDGAPTDGSVWLSDGDPRYRVTRGGSWGFIAMSCRSADRYLYAGNERSDGGGFRVVTFGRP